MRATRIAVALTVLLAACDKPPTEGSGVQAQPPPPATAPAPPPVTFVLSAAGLPEDGMWKCDPVLGDVNGDGFLDLAALPRLKPGPRVWLGDGTGHWRESWTGLDPGSVSCGGGLEFGDLNNDGHLDIAVADHCNGVFIYLGDGTGRWEMVLRDFTPQDAVAGEAEVSIYEGAEDLDVGDVNGDGNLDLLVSASDEGGMDVYLGDGTARQWRLSSQGLPHRGWANRVRLADIDLDGRLDVVASRGEGPRVWLNDGAGGWSSFSDGLPEPVVGGLYHGLAVGDLNEDGLPDLAVANWIDGPEVHLQESGGIWRKSPDVFPDLRGGAMGLGLGDLDRDGHLDLVVAGRLKPDGGFVRGVFALLGDGKGHFAHLADCGLPSTGLRKSPGIALADFDGDQVLDVVATSGLNIETVPGPSEPVIPQMILVWRTVSGSLLDGVAEGR